MREWLQRTEYRTYAFIALLGALVSLGFIAPQTTSLALLVTPFSNDVFYVAFLIFGALTAASIIFFAAQFAWRHHLFYALAMWLPAVLILIYGLSESKNFHYVFHIFIGGYTILAGILGVATYMVRHPLKPATGTLTATAWWQAQGKIGLALVALFTIVFFLSGLFRLTQYAAVDEPLWLDGRIHRYWKNIGEHDWRGTNISDKPGITVALATGIGTLFKSSADFRTTHFQGEVFNLQNDVESYYFAFRFPQLVIITLLLPLFYFFIERLTNRRAALFSYILLATSPILVGMSKIINPDSLLWIFTPLSLFSYLLFRKQQVYRYLILSGIFLGLALLTKYIANILFVFFLGLIFLELLFRREHDHASFSDSLRHSLSAFALLTFSALTTFYLLFPAVWVKPEKLLGSTLMSQAFEKVAPLFLGILAFIFIDQWLNQSRITSACLAFGTRFRSVIVWAVALLFAGSALTVLITTWLGMPLYSFVDLLASPKTIGGKSGFIGIFLTNFFPLLFGIPPLVLFLLLTTPLLLLVRRSFTLLSTQGISFLLILFCLLYYLGATVNGVASIVRYQIILFPLVTIAAGLTLEAWLRLAEAHWPTFKQLKHAEWLAVGLVTILSSYTLFTTPYPLSYASILLPKSYHIDIKDMGAGSYEAAQWLNTLPNAKEMLIWTDKDGVCKFFVGRCKRGLDYVKLRSEGLDYIIVSAGRESRTTKMMGGDVIEAKPGLIRFDKYYERSDFVHAFFINDRPSHFVKIFSFDSALPVL